VVTIPDLGPLQPTYDRLWQMIHIRQQKKITSCAAPDNAAARFLCGLLLLLPLLLIDDSLGGGEKSTRGTRSIASSMRQVNFTKNHM